ncbi:MAG: tetratricopeptide repeat protein [Bacteroidales bacterium]|nr:tetratricopeptide repeat protein [Bacteroidales bacterium]
MKINKDRFKNYDEEVKHLVLEFEKMEKSGERRYFDLDEMERIIDFYMDGFQDYGTDNSSVGTQSITMEMMEKSVLHGEWLFPASNEIRLRRAHLLCFKERFEESYAILKELESRQPDDTDVLYALGVVLSALEQPRRAIQYYNRAASRLAEGERWDGDSHNKGKWERDEIGMIYANIADEYVKMDKRKEARNFYRKALRLRPDDEHSLYELANCYEDDGLIDKWIGYYNKFVEEHPYSKVGWFCLAEGYASTALYERAIDAYGYAIAIDSNFYYAYMQMSACYEALGNMNMAVETLHDAAEHTDDKALVYFRIGDLFRLQNNMASAVNYYQKATKEDPFYADAWHALSTCYTMSLEFGDGIDCAKKALSIEPESPLYLTTLALIYADSGDNENAEKTFEHAIPYYDEFEQGWLAYADYHIMRGNYEEAINGLNRGLVGCELVMEYNKRLALCYYMTGRRNMLFNAVRACIFDNEDGAKELLNYVPELRDDDEVMMIINS